MLIGLALLGTGLFLTSVLASDIVIAQLEETGPPTAVNGTAMHTYALTGSFRIPPASFVEGSWRFPFSPGDVHVLDCLGYDDLLRTGAPYEGAFGVAGRQDGSFRVRVDDVLRNPFEPHPPPPPGGSVESTPLARMLSSPHCPGLYVVFQWPAHATGWEANQPEAQAAITRGAVAHTPIGQALMVVTILGGVAALAGGLAWRQERLSRRDGPRAGVEESTAETLLLLTERSEDWLLRTRRYLVIAGVLGVFLWYPLLVPAAWRVGERAFYAPWAPPAFAGAALVLLLGLTAIWAREFRRIDRELAEWRVRLARLKRREEQLLAELEG
ncbi:MAG TPA: hypothetical protein VM582_02440 [Candidatus Thermoplasmatota archaeon]|nr:hypothetical protein [Candidatus Thermoplasmatota archaeon]